MGTRADFYVGEGSTAEWLGSLAYDGYRIDDMKEKDASQNNDCAACWAIKTADNEKDYRAAVTKLLSMNHDATTPEQGWPWPWEDSNTTDYAYCFDDGGTHVFIFGRRNGEESIPKAEWPNMKDRQNVTLGHRSGLMIITAR